ncbi:MAG: hypothetical protein M3459_02465 [Actinomycetota bacterium]|nr:hypothetical protein [Actinomycetota bacterium]
MPTTRPRHSITETPEVAAAIDEARRVFPDADSRAAVLLELIRLGADEVERRRQSDEEEQADRRRAVRELSQMCSGELPGMDVELLKRVREEAWRD